MQIPQKYLINNYANTVKRSSFNCQGHHPLFTLLLLCVRSNLNHAKIKVLSIKGRLTLKEVAVLDVANLSAIIQDTYLLWNSMRPIDMHTAFNRAEWTGHMSPVKALSTDGAHVAHNS